MSEEGAPETMSLEESPQETSPKNKPEEMSTGSEVELAAAASSTANVEATVRFSDKDPVALLQFVEQYVKVQLIRNYSYLGYVHAICPLSHSVILSVPRDGLYTTTLIPGTSILDMTLEPCDSTVDPPERSQTPELSKDEVLAQKKKIVSWLRENLLPVTEDGDNVVFGGITIIPPYGDKNISTTNPLIALEIKKIIDRMPEDYTPK